MVGPLARNARDLALALECMSGPEPDEAKAWAWNLPMARHSRLANYRIGHVPADTFSPLTPEAREVYEHLLTALRKTGATLVEGWPHGVDPAAHVRTFQYLVFSLVTLDADDGARESARKRLQANPDDIAAAATIEPHHRWLRESQKRLAYRALWQQFFKTHDVFLLPVTFTPAFPHDHSVPVEKRVISTPDGERPYLEISSWISIASVTGLPSTAAPIGRVAAGVPVGVQILAPMWEDGTSIEFAALLADVVEGFTPPPAYRA